MEPNPPRENKDGSFGAPGDPMFVCLTENPAHDAARKARADECRRLLAEADTIRKAQEAKRSAARAIGVKEAVALTVKEK